MIETTDKEVLAVNATMEPAVERVHPPRWLITNLINPVARRVLRTDRKMSEAILLLRFRGRRTGHSYEIPVSYRRIDRRLALFTSSGWRHNFSGGAQAEVVLKGQSVEVHAELMDDPSAVAQLYSRLIAEMGTGDAKRVLGIRINVDRVPTEDELAEMAAAEGLSVVWLDLLD